MISQWVLITYVLMQGGTCGEMLNRIDPVPSQQECLVQRDRLVDTGSGHFIYSCRDIVNDPIFVNVDRDGNIAPRIK